MKKIVLALVVLAVISVSSCKKEEGAMPEAKSVTTKVAAKDLPSFD